MHSCICLFICRCVHICRYGFIYVFPYLLGLVVHACEGGGAHHRLEALEDAVKTLHVHLHEGSWVLGHLFAQDGNCALECVCGISELLLAHDEDCVLLLPDVGCVFKLLAVSGDVAREILKKYVEASRANARQDNLFINYAFREYISACSSWPGWRARGLGLDPNPGFWARSRGRMQILN